MNGVELLFEPKWDLPDIEIQAPMSDWRTTLKITALQIASYLNEPICKVREYFYTFHILKETCKTSFEKISRSAFLVLGIVVSVVLTPMTAPFGALLRGIVATVSTEQYIYEHSNTVGKTLPVDRKITFVAHNQCQMPAGYSITDGQVTPPSDRERMKNNIERVKDLDPDLICLYEIADILDAKSISSKFENYPFVIPVAGFRAIGPSSCMYVASKYEIASIEFIPFEKGTELTGRARFAEKGFLSIDIKNPGKAKPFATLVSTHLQHSEIPAVPEEYEEKSREAQMVKIAKHIEKKVSEGQRVLFLGDLNQEEKEINRFFQKNHIQWLRDPKVVGVPTWLGDRWCARLMNKKASNPLVLDYAFAAGGVADLQTEVISMDYKDAEFRKEAGSDHNLLYGTATLENN